jgi:hypothetical protein
MTRKPSDQMPEPGPELVGLRNIRDRFGDRYLHKAGIRNPLLTELDKRQADCLPQRTRLNLYAVHAAALPVDRNHSDGVESSRGAERAILSLFHVQICADS